MLSLLPETLRSIKVFALVACLVLAGWANGSSPNVTAPGMASATSHGHHQGMDGLELDERSAEDASSSLEDKNVAGGHGHDGSHSHLEKDVVRRATMLPLEFRRVRFSAHLAGLVEHPEYPPVRPPRAL